MIRWQHELVIMDLCSVYHDQACLALLLRVDGRLLSNGETCGNCAYNLHIHLLTEWHLQSFAERRFTNVAGLYHASKDDPQRLLGPVAGGCKCRFGYGRERSR